MNELEKLKSAGFQFQKRFGQNFITDVNLLAAIVSDARVEKDDFVLEVGAGAGTLTRALCKKAGKVLAFEIDQSLSPALDALAAECTNLEILYGDVLKLDIAALTKNKPFKVVANLPYYITTPVIFRMLETEGLQSLTVMVQKEVAERFTANPDTPAYGAVTAQLAAYGEPEITRAVSKKLFTPAPSVDSAVVHLKIEKKPGVRDFAVLQKLIAAAFAMRRKTLLNNLTHRFGFSREKGLEILRLADFPESVRGEALGIGQFIRLSNILASFINTAPD